MAFGFFRRRQKMVMLIMVVLMVAFLIPTGIRGLLERGPGTVVLGQMGDKEITSGMRALGERDLQVLTGYLGLGRYRMQRQAQRPGETEFERFLTYNNDRDRALNWVLLVEEARKLGVSVTEAEVGDFLAESGWTEKTIKQEQAQLQAHGYGEDDLRRAAADYLLVAGAYRAAGPDSPPPLPEIRRLCQRLFEKIRLDAVLFGVSDYLKDAPEPADKDIQEQFDKYKGRFAGQSGSESEFSFGYRQPDKVDVAWFLVDRAHVKRALEPTEEQISGYYQRHQQELTTQATGPDGAPTEVPIGSYAQAKPVIRELLKDKAAEDKIKDLLNRAREVIARQGSAPDAYVQAAQALVRPAQALLAKPAGRVPFATAALESVIERLEKNSGVRIVYPFGGNDKLSVEPKVAVKLEPGWESLPLGQVLDGLSDQLKIARLTWVACEGFDNAIFPSEPVSLVPVRAGQTGLVDFDTLAKDSLLGSAHAMADRLAGDSVATIAAAALAPKTEERQSPPLEVGADYRLAMHVTSGGQPVGRLLWRLNAAQPAHSPEALTPDIRQQVVKDLKTVKAFEAARKAADELYARLAKAGPEAELAKLAEAEKRPVTDTGFFARLAWGLGQIGLADIKGIGQSELFVEQAFSLAPADVEPPYKDRPSKVVPLPRKEQVALIQRTGFWPLTYEEYQSMGFLAAAQILARQQAEVSYLVWFAGSSIQQRVDYKPKPES